MSKLTLDSKWAGLTEEQRDTLEGWLFEENITYQEALERAEKEFGITASISSIARLYQKISDERLETEMAGYNDKISGQLAGSPDFNLEDMTYAAMMLMANRLVQTARHKPDKVKDIVSLAKALAHCQSVELRTRWFDLADQKHKIELKKLGEAAGRQAELNALMNQFLKQKTGGGGLEA